MSFRQARPSEFADGRDGTVDGENVQLEQDNKQNRHVYSMLHGSRLHCCSHVAIESVEVESQRKPIRKHVFFADLLYVDTTLAFSIGIFDIVGVDRHLVGWEVSPGGFAPSRLCTP